MPLLRTGFLVEGIYLLYTKKLYALLLTIHESTSSHKFSTGGRLVGWVVSKSDAVTNSQSTVGKLAVESMKSPGREGAMVTTVPLLVSLVRGVMSYTMVESHAVPSIAAVMGILGEFGRLHGTEALYMGELLEFSPTRPLKL